MPKGLKIIIAVVLIVVGLASMGMVWLRDSSRRPEYCSQCHAVMEPYYTSWESSDYLANEHAESAIPCQSCHTRAIGDTLGEIVTYARGEYETPLKEQELPKEWCFQCHEHGSYEQLIELTKDYAVDGEQINPHAYTVDPEAPDPDAYTVDSEAPDPHDSEQGECYQCHKIHKESPGLTSCYECHHDAIFLKCSECHKEWNGADLLGQAHAEADVTCLDCHEPTIQQQVQEGIQVATKDYQAAFAEREFPKEWCLRCHEHGSYEELAQRTEELELNPHDSHYGEMECSICHKVHKASEDYCAQCHDPVATGTGWITATQPITQVLEWWEPDMDCAYCHVMASYTESLQDATLLANAHAQEGLVCLDCHELAVLQQVHEGADAGTTELTQREFSNEFCFDCHVPNEHTSYPEIIERTEDYTVGDQKINPHASEKGEIECSSCHSMHKESPAGSSKDACLGCHGPFDKLVSATANYTMPSGEKTSPHRYVPHDSKDIPECSYCHEPHPVPLTSTEGLPKPNPRWCYGCHHERVLECGTCHS